MDYINDDNETSLAQGVFKKPPQYTISQSYNYSSKGQ